MSSAGHSTGTDPVETRYGTVSFLSDFGYADEFVGVVHSVIKSIAPAVTIVDVTHGIARHDVRAGGLALARAAQYLCPGVVVAVVDPGVGSTRRAVAVEVGDGDSILVGPDNGLLAPAVALVGGASRAVEITSAEHRLAGAGSTFDGRDVFAPAAAHLCNGVSLDSLGPAIDPATLMPSTVPVPEISDDEVIASIIWIDAFGNAQLNVGRDDLVGPGPWLTRIGDDTRVVAHHATYGDIPSSQPGLVTDSQGLLALCIDRGDASVELALNEGTEIVFTEADAPAPVRVDLDNPATRN